MPLFIAIFILTFIAGLAISLLVRSKFVGRMFGIVVLVVIIAALISGQSGLLIAITANFTQYIATNPVGIVGFIIGFLLGFKFK